MVQKLFHGQRSGVSEIVDEGFHRCFLLYIRDKEVVEVKPGGKSKLLKKVADRDQLSLGF